jgi:hypothetical protein
MSSPPVVTDRGASLLATDPELRHLLGSRDAAMFGHRRVLPVLALAAGEWSPPAAATLGEGTVALVVLTGAMLRRPRAGPARLLGPWDMIDPWTHPATWSACSPVRAAVIGAAFAQATAPWPQAMPYMLGRAAGDPDGLRVDHGAADSPRERLTELLWRLALRWGAAEDEVVSLPLALTPAALAELTGLPEPEATSGLRALERARVAIRCGDGTWLLHTAGEPPEDARAAMRDELRARAAIGLAQARATRALSAELLEEAAQHLGRRAERRTHH